MIPVYAGGLTLPPSHNSLFGGKIKEEENEGEHDNQETGEGPDNNNSESEDEDDPHFFAPLTESHVE